MAFQSARENTLESTFLAYGRQILENAPGLSVHVGSRRFLALFGVSPRVCGMVWAMLDESRPRKAVPMHLLWALVFLKAYASEHNLRVICGADEKAIRKWVWIFVELISELPVIKWNNRFLLSPPRRFYCSVDGTDFKIYEPSPFSPKWYSHKYKGPGLRYEIGISVSTGWIVWTHGPFPCGSFPDIRIFKLAMEKSLLPNETVVADSGYKNCKCEQKPTSLDKLPSNHHNLVRARHESCNRRLKQFGVLGQQFRHEIHLHSKCFHAVANLTQLMIETDFPLFHLPN